MARTAEKASKGSEAKKQSRNIGAGAKDSLLRELFLDEIKDIYWAEKHIAKVLPKMKKAATSEELKQAFEDHLEVTKEQAARLERVFEMLGEKPRGKKCEAIEGITKEGEQIIEDTETGTATRDVGLILAAQKVEHYEISTYGGLAQLADTLGLTDISEILRTTLDEEKETDVLLTDIAESSINYEASEEE